MDEQRVQVLCLAFIFNIAFLTGPLTGEARLHLLGLKRAWGGQEYKFIEPFGKLDKTMDVIQNYQESLLLCTSEVRWTWET